MALYDVLLRLNVLKTEVMKLQEEINKQVTLFQASDPFKKLKSDLDTKVAEFTRTFKNELGITVHTNTDFDMILQMLNLVNNTTSVNSSCKCIKN